MIQGVCFEARLGQTAEFIIRLPIKEQSGFQNIDKVIADLP